MPEAPSPEVDSETAETLVPADRVTAETLDSSEPSETPVVDWTPDAAALERYATLARSALLDMTEPASIGEPAGHRVEADRVVSIYFLATMTGYPGWRWTVSISHLDDADPTVLETELTPGEGALLAPEWTPWGDRLAAQNAADELAAVELDGASDDQDDDDLEDDDLDADDLDDDDDDDDDDESDDDDDDDESDDDDDDDDESDDEDSDDDEVTRVRAVLHAGDLDGVDIDDLDEAGSDGDDERDDDMDEAVDGGVTASSAADSGDVDEPGEAESDPDGAGDEHPGAVGSDDRLREDQ